MNAEHTEHDVLSERNGTGIIGAIKVIFQCSFSSALEQLQWCGAKEKCFVDQMTHRTVSEDTIDVNISEATKCKKMYLDNYYCVIMIIIIIFFGCRERASSTNFRKCERTTEKCRTQINPLMRWRNVALCTQTRGQTEEKEKRRDRERRRRRIGKRTNEIKRKIINPFGPQRDGHT